MMDWVLLLVLVPAIVVPIVLLFGFAGCQLVFPLTDVGTAPINLTALADSRSAITLRWEYNGMDPASFEVDKVNRRLAVGYEKETAPDGSTVVWNNLLQHVVRGGPAGGGYSTVEDLFRFDQALRGEKLVKRESLDQLWRAYPELSSERYGLGFAVDQSAVGSVVGHSGGFNGISAVLSMYTDAGYTITVLSNFGGGAATVVEGKARELIAQGH